MLTRRRMVQAGLGSFATGAVGGRRAQADEGEAPTVRRLFFMGGRILGIHEDGETVASAKSESKRGIGEIYPRRDSRFKSIFYSPGDPIEEMFFHPTTGEIVAGRSLVAPWVPAVEDREQIVVPMQLPEFNFIGTLAACLTPDASSLLVSYDYGLVVPWKLATRQEQAWGFIMDVRKASEGWSGCLAVSPDGKEYATASEKGLVFLDLESGKFLPDSIPVSPDLTAVRYSSDGRLVACGSRSGVLSVFERRGGRKVAGAKFGRASILSMDFGRQDASLVVGNRIGEVGVLTLGPGAPPMRPIVISDFPVTRIVVGAKVGVLAVAGRELFTVPGPK